MVGPVGTNEPGALRIERRRSSRLGFRFLDFIVHAKYLALNGTLVWPQASGF
jgi:hypothetical protein